jgi:hypothetical protein
MTIWIEVLKNKDKLSKDLLIFLQKIFDAFACDSDVKSSYKNWQLLKSMN